MQEEFKKIEETVEHVHEYINHRLRMLKFSVAETASDVISLLLARIIGAVVFTFFVLFFSIAIAVWIGGHWHHPWLGYLVVAGIYLLIGIIVWAARRRLIQVPIMNALLERLFNEPMMEDHEKD